MIDQLYHRAEYLREPETAAGPRHGSREFRVSATMASMPLRLVGRDGTIETIQTVVAFVGDSTYEIQVDGRVVGFIRRTGQGFAAHAGPEVTNSSHWQQWRLWDKAAAFLINAVGPRTVQC